MSIKKWLTVCLLTWAIGPLCSAATELPQDISSLHKAITQQTLTCQQVARATVAGIKQANFTTKKNPPINAFVSLNPSLFEQAAELDSYYQDNKKLYGPLHCVTVVLKDNIDSTETPSSSGSLALLGNQALQDAELVQRLKASGALIIGKGAMDELASGIFGISSRSGRVGNVFDTTQNPGGSSAGVAAAVAARFAMVGIGSDNSGSIRIPALFNGLYGLRPSAGLVSDHGTFPRGTIDGVYGPITRNLNDLNILLNVLAEHELPAAHRKPHIGYVTAVNGKPLYPKHLPSYLQKTIERLQRLGYVVKPVTFHDFDSERQENSAGEREDVNAYLAQFPGARNSYQDICRSGRAAILGSRQQCVDFINTLPAKNSAAYQTATARIVANRSQLMTQMSTQDVEIVLSPITASGHATYDDQTVYTWRLPLSSNSGLPALAVPTSFDKHAKLPVGLQLIGKFHAELTLLSVASQLQRSNQLIPAPKLEKSPALNHCSIETLNHLITHLGYQAFAELKKGGSYAERLPPARFQQLATPIINEVSCGLVSYRLAQLERKYQRRLGLYAMNIGTGDTVSYHAHQRFPMQSTFKLTAVAALLKQSEKIPGLLDKTIAFSEGDIVSWSPITAKHLAVGGKMTLAELAEATIRYSDNTAINLIIKALGGVEAVNQFAKQTGAELFELQHIEPALNSVPDRHEDSVTPYDMAQSMRQIFFGKVLSEKNRQQLLDWLFANTTGDKKIRAAVPQGARVADKTGTGSYGVSNDVAVIFPALGYPVVITVYTIGAQSDDLSSSDMLREATAIILTT